MASKPFDATLKELIEDDSASWPDLSARASRGEDLGGDIRSHGASLSG